MDATVDTMKRATLNDDACEVGCAAPAVSVLVPIYNVERYLRQCLESLRDQTLADIEVICINDGSTDSSRDIIEGFLSDPRFRVIDKPNSGYGASMNRGLDEARGRYLAILESDDFLDAPALERISICIGRSPARATSCSDSCRLPWPIAS